MPTKASLWRFEQLGGEGKILELSGSAAPHGRPRQGAVVRDGFKLRMSETYYGNGAPVTRHLAGIKYDDFELSGRWSDRYEGKGFAIGKREEVKSFVFDQQEVLITWTDIIHARGIIAEFDPGIESDGEVEWKMVVRIDHDEYLQNVPVLPDPKEPQDFVNRFLLAFQKDVTSLFENPLTGSPFDAVNSLISSINGVSSELHRVVDEIDALATAPLTILKRFRAAMRQMRNVLTKLRNDVDSWDAAYAMESRNSNDLASFSDAQSALSVSVLNALREIAKQDRAAQLAERGQVSRLYTAREGDTWESISIAMYGDADRAGDIRAANGIAPGSAPSPGTVYQIPV